MTAIHYQCQTVTFSDRHKEFFLLDKQLFNKDFFNEKNENIFEV